jgi:diguanylate cyclase (GGDEF)-like protein/PAS domain S-box-containing protein
MLEDLAAMVELQLQDRLRLSALQMLTEIEQRYRALIDSNPDAVYTIDTSGCFSSCNDATLQMTGYSREQFIGMPFVEIIAGEHKERVQAHFQSCLGGEAQFLRARILRGDGGSFHASISASVYSIEGQLHGVAGITRDVTPQIVAEQRLRESEARLNLALASSRMGVWECELATGILYQSPQLRMILGYPEEESRESIEEWHGRVHPDDREQAIALSRRLADQQGTRYAMEKRLRCQDGSYRWMQCHGQVTSWDTQGKPKIVVGTAADIHEQKLAEQARIRDAERMALAVQAGGVGIFEVSLNERTVHWDARMHRLFDFKRQGSGPPTEAILAAIHPDDRPRLRSSLAELVEGERHQIEDEVRVLWSDGSVHYLRALGKVIEADKHSRLLVGTCWEVTEARKLQQQLSYQATHDALTGLYNRFEFERQLESVRSTRAGRGRTHALCFIDLDRFKLVNDTAGHSAGDALLRELGQLLASSIRGSDMIARLGGDEFGLLLMDCSVEQAEKVAVKLVQRLEDLRFQWEGRVYNISASVGVAPFVPDTTSIESAMTQADVACYAAKASGRGRVSIYRMGESDANSRHQELMVAATIHEGLAQERFLLFAQPIFATSSESGVPDVWEILVRMRNVDGKIVSPAVFIPAAERYDMMRDIDRWILRETLEHRAADIAAIPQLRVSLNLSAQTLSDPAFLPFIESLVKDSPLPADRIIFEITETAAVLHVEAASEVIQALRKWGCATALDDFGSGLSSFSYLKHFRVDFVKIDGIFISSLLDSAADQRIVRSIHALAREFGSKTIAEFVENDEILAQVRSIGIDYAQGYGLGKPRALDALLTESHRQGIRSLAEQEEPLG